MKQKNLMLSIESSNGILGSLQLCKTNIVSQRGLPHDSYQICLLLEAERNGGRGTIGLPLMLSTSQAEDLRFLLSMMIEALGLVESGHDPESVAEMNTMF